MELISKLETDINELQDNININQTKTGFSVDIEEEAPEQYINNVAKVKQYIVDGDVFQVNLSRLWSAQRPGNLTPYEIYQNLTQTNPAPFSGIMQFPFGAIISSSPERLLSVKDGEAKTRPIAGTRPRGSDNSGDDAFKDELIEHPKERAEHIMLIDLERNDLGRICEPGSG